MSNAKHKVLVMGAGKIGVTVANLLNRTNDYTVFIADAKPPQLSLPDQINFIKADIAKPNTIKQYIQSNSIQAIVSCLPYNLTLSVAQIASETGIHYFDPTEDIATTSKVFDLAKQSIGTFAPQCGLAPGFISITTNSLMDGFAEIDFVKMRVGALTQNTGNSLNYAYTWSVDGVINEYINPCLVIENKQKKMMPALGGLETLVVDNSCYEAFHTSGGVGSLVDSYYGKVNNMDYKTMRYKGHCEKMSFILNDLRLKENPDLAKQILSKVIPFAQDDKVVVYVSVQGYKNGVFSEKTYTNTLYPVMLDGETFTAIQMTTATGICTIIDLVMHEKILSGVVLQEQVKLDQFLANRFGRYYAKECL